MGGLSKKMTIEIKKEKNSKTSVKKAKTFLVLVLATILILCIGLLTGCGGVNVSCPPTMEENIEIISERVQKKFIDSGQFESFEVHPVFVRNILDWDYLLIEFAPIGFMYVQIVIGEKKVSSNLFRTNWERYSSFYPTEVWDDMTSHFYGIDNEQRYFFIISDVRNFPDIREVIPAIKRDGKYINLISHQAFSEYSLESQEFVTLNISSEQI